ncbi:2-dehydropantoate 2-reductase [Teratosphaeria nubilosa]|uniref:2-dehydropantoate 2-reductase n=1 Tax=Teratosphaeria nubilosa TaxID=161662 RepID=A0A6G1KUT0_9PEZI|nr:2-dehydropantoate 2-reductase [Teratosphaeria nubilosa]
MVQVLIFGAGGVGALYGYLLHRGGANITTVCRSNYNAVKDRGILIRSKIFGRIQYSPTPVRTIAEAAQYEHFDYIVVGTKAFPGTAALIKDAVGPMTAIVLAQNGIAIEEEYGKLYPENTIISGVIYLPVTQVEQGIIEHGPLERFEIGTYPANATASAKQQAKRFSDLFQAGGGSCSLHEDIQPRRWMKVALNAAWNPTTALSLCDYANFLRSSPHAEPMIRKIMKEAGTIATAAGYPNVVTDETIEHDIQRPKGRLETGGKEPSMLTDVREGRALEVEAIVGNTLRIGREHGVDTPCLELLYALAQGRNYVLAPDESWRPIARQD